MEISPLPDTSRNLCPLPPNPTLPLAPLHPCLRRADRSGQSVKTDAAKYVTHHDAEGIGAFLDADFEALTSVLSITVDYLAGPRPHVDRRPCCVFIAAAQGLACLACLSRVVVGTRWGVTTVTPSTAARCL